MLNNHPVKTLYEHVTHIVAHALPAPEHFEGKCSCCGRDAADFDYQAYSGKDGYGVPYMHCQACEVFNVGDIDVMGIERNETLLDDGTKTGVPHKFGMLAGSGVLIQNNGKVTIFTPPGTYKKLPDAFLSKFAVVECSTLKQVALIAKMDLVYPLLYIQDFGKKTRQLVTGLRYSLSENAVIACTDDGNTATTQFQNTLDLKKVAEIVSLAESMTLSVFKAFKTQIAALCLGGRTPEEFSEWMRDKGTEDMLQIFKLLPKDPHLRLSIMDMVNKIKGAA